MDKGIVKLIRKSNDLVEARYKFDIWETRLFTKMLTMIRKDDEDFKDYKIYLKEVVADFDLHKNKESYEYLKLGAKKLMKKTFYIPYEEDGVKRFFETPVIAGLDGAVGDGRKMREDHLYIKISFHPIIKPYLLQLKSQFTVYDVRNILKLPSTYSIRIYELLKQYENIKKRTFDIVELKEILGIQDKYKLYGHFRERVIEKAKKDLQQYTDISFTYEAIKKGRAVSKIRFYIVSQNLGGETIGENPENATNSEPVTTENTPFETLFPKVKKWISAATLKKWLQDYPEEQVVNGVQYTLNRLEKGESIPNVGGYLNKMVQQTRLFDVAANSKEKAVTKKKAVKERKEKKAELEAIEKKLRTELYEQELAIIKKLFKADAEAKDAAFLAAKTARMSGYDYSLTDEENYKTKPSFRSAVHNKMKKLYPEKFKAVQMKYAPKIKLARKKIRLL